MLSAMLGASGCYDSPVPAGSCQVTCTDECPGGFACLDGLCVAPGEDCAPTFVSVSAGGGFACAIDERQLLWCWGSNERHQISSSEKIEFSLPRRIGAERWDAIATGGGHTCGIREGELSCWGANEIGQVSGTVSGDAVDPIVITVDGGPATWSQVATGYNSTCAIGEGRIYCWGSNERGQLGNGTQLSTGTPTPVSTTLTDWTFVSTSGYALGGSNSEPRSHTCAISASTGLWCWGGNHNYELGTGTNIESLTPVQIALPSPPISVAAAAYSTCVTTEDQSLYCWGYGINGQVGDPTLVDPTVNHQPSPVLASGLTGWTQVYAAEQALCGLRADEVWCWGASGSGGLGNGVWSGSRVFSRIASGVTALSLAPNTNLDDLGADLADLDLGCLVSDGKIQCWGSNQFGQLGQGAATLAPAPVAVVGDHTWSTLSAGQSHICGVSEGKLYCWGSTVNGQVSGVVSGTTNVPCGSLPDLPCDFSTPMLQSFATNVRELSLGTQHTCVLGDSLWCWGNDDYWQLGAATLGPAPVEIPGAWTKLHAVRGYTSCAVQGADTQCWGSFVNGNQAPATVPDLAGATEIATSTLLQTSTGFGCYLDASQQLGCFGDNRLGQFGNGVRPNSCGNGLCDGSDTCENCAQDCLGCPVLCPNAKCDAGETSATCPADCGAAPMTRLGRAYAQIAVGFGSTSSGGTICGITDQGGIECWGRNRSGIAGVVDAASGLPPRYVYAPTPMGDLTGCTDLGVGDTVACAVCGGEAYCWGDHRRGAVGSGPITALPISVPRKVDVELDGDTFVQVVVGSGYACARTTRGRAYCWGSNIHGALGTGVTGANLPTPIKL